MFTYLGQIGHLCRVSAEIREIRSGFSTGSGINSGMLRVVETGNNELGNKHHLFLRIREALIMYSFIFNFL